MVQEELNELTDKFKLLGKQEDLEYFYLILKSF